MDKLDSKKVITRREGQNENLKFVQDAEASVWRWRENSQHGKRKALRLWTTNKMMVFFYEIMINDGGFFRKTIRTISDLH